MLASRESRMPDRSAACCAAEALPANPDQARKAVFRCQYRPRDRYRGYQAPRTEHIVPAKQDAARAVQTKLGPLLTRSPSLRFVPPDKSHRAPNSFARFPTTAETRATRDRRQRLAP